MHKSGIAWFLTEWHVKILHRPENGEILNITTWVRGKAPASIVYRDFILKDEDGVDVIRAEAKFALLDLIASRLTRINEELLAAYGSDCTAGFVVYFCRNAYRRCRGLLRKLQPCFRPFWQEPLIRI